jgi:exodeoxyribonuclease-1
VLHISSRYRSDRGCLAMIVPLARHPTQPNGIIAFDLDSDPTDLIELDASDIADRVYTARADLPEGVERIALKTVHANKAPALAPLSVLRDTDTARIGLDVERCRRHLDLIRAADGIADKVRNVFSLQHDRSAPVDADLALYNGFATDADRRLLAAVRATPASALATRQFPFADGRFADLLFRYRARNFPDTLSFDEQSRWNEHRTQRLTTKTEATTLTFEEYTAMIATLRTDESTTLAQRELLDQLQDWGLRVAV